MGKIVVKNLFLLIAAAALCSIALSCSGSEKTLLAQKETPVYEYPYPFPESKKFKQNNSVIYVMSVGESAKVVKSNYEKDYLIYEVKLDNGRQGFIVHSSDIKITKSEE